MHARSTHARTHARKPRTCGATNFVNHQHHRDQRVSSSASPSVLSRTMVRHADFRLVGFSIANSIVTVGRTDRLSDGRSYTDRSTDRRTMKKNEQNVSVIAKSNDSRVPSLGYERNQSSICHRFSQSLVLSGIQNKCNTPSTCTQAELYIDIDAVPAAAAASVFVSSANSISIA